METMELHRGRLIDHIQRVAKDLAAPRKFYEAVYHGEAKRSVGPHHVLDRTRTTTQGEHA